MIPKSFCSSKTSDIVCGAIYGSCSFYCCLRTRRKDQLSDWIIRSTFDGSGVASNGPPVSAQHPVPSHSRRSVDSTQSSSTLVICGRRRRTPSSSKCGDVLSVVFPSVDYDDSRILGVATA